MLVCVCVCVCVCALLRVQKDRLSCDSQSISEDSNDVTIAIIVKLYHCALCVHALQYGDYVVEDVAFRLSGSRLRLKC